jgi:nitroreductase
MRRFLKKYLPSNWVVWIKSLLHSFDILVLRIFSKSSITSSLYYAFISSKFQREHQGVILGKLAYEKSLRENGQPRYHLRRNIHRLEKGLLMRPQKDIFGTDYIVETVDAYEKIKESSSLLYDQNVELIWAHDVLVKYFSTVGSQSEIDQAKRKFLEINKSQQISQDCIHVPYKKEASEKSSVAFDDFLLLTKQRKSVRWFQDKPVSREVIDKALVAASMAPSGCNRQPYEFRIFDNIETVHDVASLPGGAVGFKDNIPAIAVIIGKFEAFFDERDRHLIYIDSSLAAMSFILALETLGLSSCAINWPDIKDAEKKITIKLQLKPEERVIMLIAFGYADPERLVAYSQKKSIDDLRRYNFS